MYRDQSAAGSKHPHGLSETLAPGVRVGGARYILRRILGRGAVTVVWLARDVKLEQEVALKVLPESLLNDPNAVERLKTETRRNLQLAHPQIARTYDFIQDYWLVAIAMEYVDGWSLATLRVDRSEQRYGLGEVTPWVRQLCGALSYAHTEPGILHLALKPANLMLNSREQLKLTDFGLGRSLQGIAGPTDLHLAAGALGYLSPQQALGEKPSVLDDVYGLGATIYDLLTGTAPFFKGQVLAQVCDRKPPTMTDRLFELGIEDSIPLVVEDTVALCLEKDPAKRPQSIGHVLQLLERSDIPAPVSVAEPAKPEPPAAPAPPPAVGEAPAPERASEAPAPEPASEAAAPESAEGVPTPEPASEASAPAPPEVAAEPAGTPVPAEAPARASRRRSLLAGAAFCALAVACTGAWFWATHAGKRPATSAAAAGALDTAFNPATNSDHEIRVVLEQPDHRILIGGMFTQFGEGARRGLARLEADGTTDASFAVNVGGDVFALALQPDGRIVLGGSFNRVNGHLCRRVARLNVDGSLDRRFAARATVNGSVRAVVVQPDSKILVAGSFDLAAGHSQNRVARFNADGERDATFNPGRGASGVVWSLALQPDGKILVAGDFARFDQNSCKRLVRLKSSGEVDSDFNVGSGADAVVYAVAVQADGRILVGGDFTRINQVERNRIARLNPDGSLDTTFNAGAGPNTGIRCLAMQPDGKILMGGIFTSVAGVARGRVARLKADGSLDASFNPGEGASEVVRWVAPEADGKVLVAGGFSRFAGKEYVRLARLHGGAG